jgi:hypothetical protein
MSDTPDEQPTTEDELRARIDEVEEFTEFVDTKHERRVDDTVKPRLDDHDDQLDTAREERADLQAAVKQLQQQVTMLDERLEGIAGLADDQETNPQKRVADLREAMIRRAEAREDREDNPRVKMWWREVQDLFADYGHGEVSKPDCYKAMREAADSVPGFEESSKTNQNGNDVKAIRLNLTVLRGSEPGRSPTTDNGVSDRDAGPANQPAEGDD